MKSRIDERERMEQTAQDTGELQGRGKSEQGARSSGAGGRPGEPRAKVPQIPGAGLRRLLNPLVPRSAQGQAPESRAARMQRAFSANARASQGAAQGPGTLNRSWRSAPGRYRLPWGDTMTASERKIVAHAIAVLEKNAVYRHDDPLTSPKAAKQLAFLQLAAEPNEVFACLFLDNRHRMIAFEKVFFGSIDGASIHPRVIVQKALWHNAAAVILSHNHPSGITEPSREDREITQRLQDALTLFDVRILDHLIVGSRVGDTVSLAEQGLL